MQISLTQEVWRVNINSLFGDVGLEMGGRVRGIKRKALFENEQMPCVCPEGAEYFRDREAEGSECQRRSQLCSRKRKLYESQKKKEE